MRYAPVTPETAPEEPLTLAEVKAHLRIEYDDETEDTLVAALIQAARERAELTGHLLLNREWDLMLDEFPSDEIEIRKAPVREIVSLTYGDSEITDYASHLSGRDASRVMYAAGGSWPDVDASIGSVVVRFLGGYESPADIPQLLKQGMLLDIADMYEHREETVVGNIVNPRGAVKAIYDLFGLSWWVVT